MSYEIEWRPGAIEDITALFEYLVENASLWDARNVTERLITATDRLAGVLRRNPRFFRYPSFSPATSASRSMISLLL